MASYLTLWLVLLACLRGTGLSQAQIPWQTSLAAFAFIRLLTALPITPGDLPPIPLGALACLTWRLAPALTGASRRRASPLTAQRRDSTGPLHQTSSAHETASQPQPAPDVISAGSP